MVRTTANRSARAARRGRYSQNRTPGSRVAVVPYSPRISAGASGLGSQVSCCGGPPSKQKTMHERALRLCSVAACACLAPSKAGKLRSQVKFSGVSCSRVQMAARPAMGLKSLKSINPADALS